jgi:hypothetical protein
VSLTIAHGLSEIEEGTVFRLPRRTIKASLPRRSDPSVGCLHRKSSRHSPGGGEVVVLLVAMELETPAVLQREKQWDLEPAPRTGKPLV